MRFEWKALILSAGLEDAAIRVVAQLGRLFAAPVASRFYRVVAAAGDDGRSRPSAIPVPDLASANRLELVLATREASELDPAWPDGDESDPGGGSQRLLVELATPPDDTSPPAVWLVLEVDGRIVGGTVEVAERVLSWSREELEGGRLLGARFAEKGGPTLPGPKPPLAGDAFISSVDEGSVIREYGDVALYVEAFDSWEEHDGRLLVSRALEPDPKRRRRRLLASNAALARIARPRRTLWVPPIPPPLGVALERPARPALRFTRTEEPGPAAIYTVQLDEGASIDAAEIVLLQSLVTGSETLPDGRHAARVSVVFDDESVARREMRPLLDVGVQVLVKDGLATRPLD